MLHMSFLLRKKSCRVVLDSIAESLGLSLCLRESMLCARKEPILPLDRTGMVFLKDGIDRATEQTKILLKIPGTLRKAQTAGSDTISITVCGCVHTESRLE